MFEDKDYIKNLVNQRDDDQIVIPLYVQIYGKKYSLLELKDVKVRFTEGAFKVGYGTADALFMPNSFPINRIRDFDVITVFTEYDDRKDRTIRYMVFESGNIDLPDVEEEDKLSEEICSYFDMLYTHVKDVVDDYFKSLIAEETVPIIPKEKPKKEGPKFNEGLREYSGELSKYSSSWDPEFVNEETPEEDPLEALRKEVAEYSQDDDSEEESPFEEDPEEVDEEEASEVAFEFEDESEEEDEYPRVTGGGILGRETVDFINGEGKYSYEDETIPGVIIETDKTGSVVTKATEVEFISQGNTDDDYLAEGVEFGNGRVDMFGNEEEIDDDYSTDFDVF